MSERVHAAVDTPPAPPARLSFAVPAGAAVRWCLVALLVATVAAP